MNKTTKTRAKAISAIAWNPRSFLRILINGLSSSLQMTGFFRGYPLFQIPQPTISPSNSCTSLCIAPKTAARTSTGQEKFFNQHHSAGWETHDAIICQTFQRGDWWRWSNQNEVMCLSVWKKIQGLELYRKTICMTTINDMYIYIYTICTKFKGAAIPKICHKSWQDAGSRLFVLGGKCWPSSNSFSCLKSWACKPWKKNGSLNEGIDPVFCLFQPSAVFSPAFEAIKWSQKSLHKRCDKQKTEPGQPNQWFCPIHVYPATSIHSMIVILLVVQKSGDHQFFPLFTGVSYTLGGAEFLPSTVV